MKNVIAKLIVFSIAVFLFSSCDKTSSKLTDELLGNNEYQIKIDNKIYDEGKNIFAGISSNLSDDNTMIAGVSTVLSITFERSNYNNGEVLIIGVDGEPNVNAMAVGLLILNPDTGNEEFVTYFAQSGTATIVNKGKIEFNLTCYRLSDVNLDDSINQDAVPFTLSGFIKENNPE